MAKGKKKKDRVDRSVVTERNKARRRNSEDARRERLIARTHALIGQHVAVRTKDFAKPLVGTVLEVISKSHDKYPHDAKRRHGNYLKVRTTIGDLSVSRHRAKIIRDKPTKESNAV